MKYEFTLTYDLDPADLHLDDLIDRLCDSECTDATLSVGASGGDARDGYDGEQRGSCVPQSPRDEKKPPSRGGNTLKSNRGEGGTTFQRAGMNGGR